METQEMQVLATDRFVGWCQLVGGATCVVAACLFGAVDHYVVWCLLFGCMASVLIAFGITNAFERWVNPWVEEGRGRD
jgi:hypothetical protein